MSFSRVERLMPQVAVPFFVILMAVELLKTLYVIETGKGDITIFECIENDGKAVFGGVYCFDHWVLHTFKPANDN